MPMFPSHLPVAILWDLAIPSTMALSLGRIHTVIATLDLSFSFFFGLPEFLFLLMIQAFTAAQADAR